MYFWFYEKALYVGKSLSSRYSSGYNGAAGQAVGLVRLYDWNETLHDWQQAGGDIEGENPADFSGSSLALSADSTTVVIGAPLNDDQPIKLFFDPPFDP